MCGGTLPWCGSSQPSNGLSPRVRGNQPGTLPNVNHAGSIPACAGEPMDRDRGKESWRVYPRVCGGTDREARFDVSEMGLSPRVRGNPYCATDSTGLTGSIPACAGEPSPVGSPCPPARVYPRVCGGTIRTRPPFDDTVGLSPRVRGNPCVLSAGGPSLWSIPACAGEPYRWARRTIQVKGLSPRVRGNRSLSPSRRRPIRSIPACAGEPQRPDSNH